VAVEPAGHYAAEDADITLRLHHALWPKLAAEPSLRALYEDIEVPLLHVLSHIEYTGVRIDAEMLKKQGASIAETIEQVQSDAFADAGREFNLGSPKQIGEIFFDEKQFPIVRKTPKGQPSTAEDVLEQLAMDYPLPRLILRHRGLTKLMSTYIEKLPLQINPTTHRVHTSYNQAVASTGRLSSTDPNLQNIPVRTEEGRRIREAFIAEKGYRLLAADYSQIELRIMAHLSDDAGLVSAFENGLDVHRATAAEVFGVPLEAVDSDQRRSAKAINFGLIYGMSAFGLAKQLDIGRGEAQEYINLYFDRYPGVKRYMDETRALAKEQGFVETVFGRRLYLPDINARNAQLRNYAERTAINAPMQGTAADIIKRAMITVDGWLRRESVDARIIMQVHDELVLEVKAGELDAVGDEVRRLMVDSATLKVPLEVDVGVGNSWEEAH
jgi:DNA polymerase-1